MPVFANIGRWLLRRSGGQGFRPLTGLWLLVLVAAINPVHAVEPSPASGEAEAPGAVEEEWQVIYMAGTRIGYGHVATFRRSEPDGTEVIVTDSLNSMTINRFNMKLTMNVHQHTEETADGQLLSFRFVLDNPPVSKTQTVGRIEGDELQLETTVNDRTTTTRLPWDASIKSPAWQDRDLTGNPLKPGETRKFKMFDPQFNKPAVISLAEKGRVRTRLLDGTEIEATKITASHSIVPGFTIDSFLDESGKLVKSETSLLQTVTYTVDEATALEELDDAPLDLAIETLVPVERIPGAHTKEQIVYRIEVSGGDAARHFATGSTQKIKQVSPEVIELTVTSVKPGTPGSEAAPDQTYLQATRFLDYADARVEEHATNAAEDRKDPVEIAVAMEKYVHDKLRNKNFATGLATASEVAREMAGDCTEHAVLLAAMLRARGIPSRVAVGLVYSERHSAFGGHMWTEAFLSGQWAPLDATLGLGGIGAGHIKVTDSSLDEDAPAPVAAFLPMMHLLGKMKLEVVSTE
jgi:hypothetical protein